MKVLVTGGAGFIGSNLVRSLLQQGDQVVVLDNLSSGFVKNLRNLQDAEFVQGDVRDQAVVEKVMKNVDVIYHLAASVGNKRSIDNPVLDADINVMGTLCLLEAARKFNVRKMVFSSSAGIFGELKTLPIREDHPVEPRTPYACSKLYAEKVALAYADLYDIEAVCLRYFNVYGPHQRFDAYGNVIPIFVFKMLNNEALSVYGDGEQTRDFVNVRDVVQANMKAAQARGVSGAFNIASGSSITINGLIKKLSCASDIKPVVHYVAKRPGDVLHSLADVSAAQQAFGYVPSVTMDQGLEEYLAWANTEVQEPFTS